MFRHWGVVALEPEGLASTYLTERSWRQRFPELGKTFDHIAFGLAGDALWSFVMNPAKEHCIGSLPRFDRYRCPR